MTSIADTVIGSPTACTTRTYTLDADSNRSSLKSYPDDGSNTSSGHCTAATTPVTTAATFDAADRVTSAGYAYDSLGRSTAVPGTDALGVGWTSSSTGTLSVGYFSNDMVASQAQGGTSMTWSLDPLQNRLLAQYWTSWTTTNHYANDSDSPSWTSTSASAWVRNLTGPNGMLAATQAQDGTIILQLTNMHGDTVATVADTTSATGTSSYSESTEFGAPRTPSSGYRPSGYLGGDLRSSSFLGGTLGMGVRLYNPATGRFLSTDPIPGGNDPYVYPTDPINDEDLTGDKGVGRGSSRNRQCSELAAQIAQARNKVKQRADEMLEDRLGLGQDRGHIKAYNDSQKRLNNLLSRWDKGPCGGGGCGVQLPNLAHLVGSLNWQGVAAIPQSQLNAAALGVGGAFLIGLAVSLCL